MSNKLPRNVSLIEPPEKYEDHEFSMMPTERLQEVAHEITAAINRIKTQIQRAKAKAAVSQQYADADWFSRARHALRVKGRQHQLVLVELAERRKAQKQAQSDRVERCFVQLARQVLAAEVFQSLMAQAIEMASETDAAR